MHKMRYYLLTLLLAGSLAAQAQSKSYEALMDRFKGQPDVHSFSLGGWLCRAALSLAVLEEDEDPEVRLLHRAMADINHVRFIVIPKEEFRAQGVSVNGFRKYLERDHFELMADVKDNGDHVTFYHRETGQRKAQYFVLIEESDEVVAIEMKGYVDPEIFNTAEARITLYGK